MNSRKQSTSVISGPEAASPEPVGAQASVEESQEELTSDLDVGECEDRAREMLRVGKDADVTTVPSRGEGFFPPEPTSGPRHISSPGSGDGSPTPGVTVACCVALKICECFWWQALLLTCSSQNWSP